MSRHILLFVFCALMGVGPADAEVVSDQVEDIDQVLILNAAKVTLKAGTEAGTWQINLTPQAGNLVSSKPTVAFRTVYGKTISDQWAGWFENKPTPAVLAWQDNKGDHGLVLEVDKPTYSKNSGALRFIARSAPHATGTLQSFSRYDGNLPMKGVMRLATFYLDDTQARVIHSSNSGDFGQTINGCAIQPYTSCPNANLANANLANADLAFALLASANFANANLASANLQNTFLVTANFSGANLSAANLSHAYLVNASLINALLTGAFMPNMNLTGAAMDNADLTYADLSGSYLTNTILIGANLTRAFLFKADLTGALLVGSTFCQTTMPDGSVNNSGC